MATRKPKSKLETSIQWIIKNWNKIPDTFKVDIHGNTSDIKDLKAEEHLVVLLLDRQKPSRERSWDFDEERIGVTKSGKIVWGFDSGCSCPSPWMDSYPNCYNVSKEWKEFTVKTDDFDADWSETCLAMIEQIKQHVKTSKKG